MPDVTMPNGDIVNFPDDMPKEQIREKIASKFPEIAKKGKPLSGAQPYAAGAIMGIPMGADIAGAVAALGMPQEGQPPWGNFSERQAAAKQFFEQKATQGIEESPAATITGMVGTGLGTALLTPAKLLQGPSVMSRAVKGAGVGAGYGALYGLGEGESLDERMGNAISGAVTGGAFGAIGNTAADIIGAGVRGGRSLAQRAAALSNKIRRPEPNIVVQGTAEQLAPDLIQGAVQLPVPQPSAPMSMERIPLTKGQATQNAKQQSLEFGALGGAYGDEARALAEEARVLQSQSAKDALSGIAGTELTQETASQASSNLVGNLKKAYASSKAKTNAAYKKVGELSQDAPLVIGADYVRDGIVPSLKDWARKGSNGLPWDLGSADMSNAKRLYDQAAQFSDMKKLSGVNFNRMEHWRGRVSQGIANSKTPSEKAFLGGLLERYDTAMKTLPREAIKSGDENIIKAFENARYARKEQGVLFERSKLVKDVLQNDDLTNEQFANVLTSMGPKSGSYVRDILRTAANDPTRQQALQGQIKQSILGNILNRSLSAEVKAGGTVEGGIEKIVSFDRLSTELGKLIKNKTLFEKAIPDPVERKTIQEIYNASSLIKSVKPGTKNYSNTAYVLYDFLKTISPSLASANVFGIGAGTSLKAMGQAGAANEVRQSLEPVLKGVLTEHTGAITNFGQKYGRQTMVGAAGTANRIEEIE